MHRPPLAAGTPSTQTAVAGGQAAATGGGAVGEGGTAAPPTGPPYEFRIIKEEIRYSRYLNVFNRVVEHPRQRAAPANSGSGSGGSSPAAHTVEYDVVGSRTRGCRFVCVFPFDSATKTVTLLSEYAQGANELALGLPCGGFSEGHASLEECARRELSEEARLTGGDLIKLVEDGHPGLLEVKWCKNRFTPYLALDPEVDPDPHPRDLEEFIEISRVSVPALKRLMYGGDMMLPSIVTCSLALEYLESHGLL